MNKKIFIAVCVLGGSVNAQEIPKEVTELLSSTRFEDRVKGHEQLTALSAKGGAVLLPDLIQLYKGSEQPELRARISGVMKRIVIGEKFGSGPGYVGIRMSDDTVVFEKRALPSIQVIEVVAKSPADLAGLVVGDQVVRVDQLDFEKDRMAKVAPSLAFSNYVKTKRPGELTDIEVVREGKRKVLQATLALMPKELRDQQRLMGFLREEASAEDKERFYRHWLREQVEE